LLQKKVKWNWTKHCQKAFKELKSKLASKEVLTHYDPDLPIKLDCDVLAYGIGGAVSHSHVWWPLISKHIEQVVHDCSSCQSTQNASS